jgi:lipoprotein-releasing system permease protein
MQVSLRLLARGLLIGNIAGIGLCLLQLHFKIFSLNASTYYLDSVPINFNLLHIVLVNVGTTLCCLLMMLLPTLILTKITPIKAIRFS